jgi:hypothetical protein
MLANSNCSEKIKGKMGCETLDKTKFSGGLADKMQLLCQLVFLKKMATYHAHCSKEGQCKRKCMADEEMVACKYKTIRVSF